MSCCSSTRGRLRLGANCSATHCRRRELRIRCVDAYREPLAVGCRSCAATCADSQNLSIALQPDGSWLDVDYSDRTGSIWKTILHLERTLSMIRSYHCPPCGVKLAGSSSLLAAVHSAFGYWLEHDFTNPNWWWQDIGTPDLTGAIMIMLSHTIVSNSSEPRGFTAAELNKTNEILLRGGAEGHGVGQNLLWTQQVAINRAVLDDDYSLANRVFGAMWGGVKLVPQSGQGVQSDGSFHFHGTILYSGG
eukprot:SAG31_NODE_6479_length_2002_cov_2.075145_1_plen_248_part_00